MKFIKLICITLILAAAAGLTSCGLIGETVYAKVSEGNSADGFFYDLYENGTATVTGRSGGEPTLVIPATLDGHAVTAIGDSAFEGDAAVIYVKGGENLRKIGTAAFASCENLVAVDLPASLECIGELAFSGCMFLARIKGGENVKEIASSAFFTCTALGDFDLPASLETVGENAFYGCKSLRYAILSDKIKSIGPGAFAYCEAIAKADLGGLTEIPESAFEKCTSLSSITIGDKVKTVGASAFRGCEALSSVTLGKGITMIGDCAFEETAWLSGKTEEFVTVAGILIKYNGTAQNVVIPDGVRVIADAFSGNRDVRSVEIGGGVEIIGERAFSGCSSLAKVTIAGKVNVIGAEAFFGCGSLSSVYISGTVKKIERSAFGKCTSIATVNYGGGVSDWKKIELGEGNTALTSVNIYCGKKP